MKRNRVSVHSLVDLIIDSFNQLSAWLCPVCNKPALYTDLFLDQLFINIIDQCSPNVKAIEYEINGQWKAIEEEKLSRRAQREKEAYKVGKVTNGTSSVDTHQSGDYDSDDEQINLSEYSIDRENRNRSSTLLESIERQVSITNQDDIPIIELDDD